MFIKYSLELIDKYISAIDVLIELYTNYDCTSIVAGCPLCKVASEAAIGSYTITNEVYKLRSKYCNTGIAEKFAFCESCPHYVFSDKLESYLQYAKMSMECAEPICVLYNISAHYSSMRGNQGIDAWEKSYFMRDAAIVRLNGWKAKLLEIKNEYV